MYYLTFCDIPHTATSDDDIRIDNENLDAISQSVNTVLYADTLCLDVMYACIGCVIAYIMAQNK